jgi:hypothetical protein
MIASAEVGSRNIDKIFWIDCLYPLRNDPGEVVAKAGIFLD